MSVLAMREADVIALRKGCGELFDALDRLVEGMKPEAWGSLGGSVQVEVLATLERHRPIPLSVQRQRNQKQLATRGAAA